METLYERFLPYFKEYCSLRDLSVQDLIIKSRGGREQPIVKTLILQARTQSYYLLCLVYYMSVICMSPFDASLFFVSAEQEIEFDNHS